MRISIKVLRCAALVLALAAIPFVFIALNVNPAIFAGGFIGYGYSVVVPEVSANPSVTLGIDQTNSASRCRASPISYQSGVPEIRTAGISAPSAGVGGRYFLSFNGNHQGGTTSTTDGNADMPNGWNWHTPIPHLVEISSSEIRAAISGKGYKYTDSSGTWQGEFGVDSTIKYVGSEYVLYGTNGSIAKFYNFSETYKAGAVKKVYDAYGNFLEFEYHLDTDTLTELRGKLKTVKDYNHSSTTEELRTWAFEYYKSDLTPAPHSANLGKVKKITLKEDGGDEIASMEFEYHDASATYETGSGTPGDLMRLKITEKDSNDDDLERHMHFRYYTQSLAHKLKYVVGPQSYEELKVEAAAVSKTPLSAADSLVADHADSYMEYYSSGDFTGFVKRLNAGGQGCSCDCVAGRYDFEYETNTLWEAGTNNWLRSVTQENPDGSVRIIDVNEAGQVLNDVLQEDDTYTIGEQRWIRHYVYDSGGHLTEAHSPSACGSYSYHTVTATTSNVVGLVELFSYNGDGCLTARKVKRATSSDVYLLEKLDYTDKTLGNQKVYFRDEVIIYREEIKETEVGANDGDKTTINYRFHSDSADLDGDSNTTEDSLAVKEIEVIHPKVITAENGSDSADAKLYQYFNTDGRLAWAADELGSVTYREFDDELGLVTKVIADVNTSGESLTPPTDGSGTYSCSGLSLSTTFTYLENGKRSGVDYPGDTVPGARKERFHYTHLSGGEPVVLRYQHVDGSASPIVTGAVEITVLNFDRKVVTTARGILDSNINNTSFNDDFDDGEGTIEAAFSGDLYWRRENVYEGGQLAERLEFEDAEDTIDDAGNEDDDIYISEYGYDNAGRLAKVKDAGGTISRTYYNFAGRVTRIDVGTNDYNANDDLSEDSGTNNMVTVREFYYDGEETTTNATGDGNLTRKRELVEDYVDDDSARDIDYTYDWRNRIIAAAGEVVTFAKWGYDNLSRVTSVRRYKNSESSANLRALKETKYDARGRVYEEVYTEVAQDGAQTPGETGATLTAENWYDKAGRRIKTQNASGAIQKFTYDALGRMTWIYTTVDTSTGESSYSAASTLTDDAVVSQVKHDYDAAGNLTLKTKWERKTGSTAVGAALTTTTGKRFYTAYWYNILGDRTHEGYYGEKSSYTRGVSPPVLSASDVLVKIWTYDDLRELQIYKDPEGKEERFFYDSLGRTTATVSNYDDGTPGGIGDEDTDRTVEIEYDQMSRVKSRTAYMSGDTDCQTTSYVYGVTEGSLLGQSRIASGGCQDSCRLKKCYPVFRIST